MIEDLPSQVGSESQDHLQAKSPWASHPSDDNLPPGFGGPLADKSQIKISDIPVIKWKCSLRILLDEEWRVVAGDESKEVDAENQRELRVLEAFYPGASSIPQNPSVPADVENAQYDDQQTTIIPVLPVEDDDTEIDSASDFPTQSSVEVGTEPSGTDDNNTPTSLTLPAGPDIMAALSAISNSKEQGSSMIDQDLLIKILSNPKLVENLVANRGAGSVSSNTSSLYPSSTHDANGVVTTTTPAATSNAQFYPPQPSVIHVPTMVQPNFGAQPARDASYYKNLIQQHGGERQETTPPVQQHLGYRYNQQPGAGGGLNAEMVNSNNNGNNQRPRDSKPKEMKPCMYFNSSRGCRHGANCLFQHDPSAYQPRNQNNGNINNSEMQSAKRMRFDRD